MTSSTGAPCRRPGECRPHLARDDRTATPSSETANWPSFQPRQLHFVLHSTMPTLHDNSVVALRPKCSDFDNLPTKIKGKVLPYSLPSAGPRDDLGVHAVTQQVTLSYQPGGRLPLLSARPSVTSVAFTRWRQPYTR